MGKLWVRALVLCAGKRRVREGDVLKFALPLPRDHAEMLRFLRETREVMEAAEARQAPPAADDEAGRSEGRLEAGQALDAQPPPRPPPGGMQSMLLAFWCGLKWYIQKCPAWRILTHHIP